MRRGEFCLNGVCDLDYNTSKCGYDGGDCLVIKYPNCGAKKIRFVGDGTCNKRYNTSECEFDGGDCISSGVNIKFTAWKRILTITVVCGVMLV